MCNDGYILASEACALTCAKSGKTCSSSTNDLTCNDGYALNGITKLVCQACQNGVKYCPWDLTKATECKTGYTLTGSACCSTANSCLTCETTKDDCKTCATTHDLKSGKCVKKAVAPTTTTTSTSNTTNTTTSSKGSIIVATMFIVSGVFAL